MKPSESFRRMMSVARNFAIICGADVIDPNYHFNAITGCVYLLIFLYFTLTFYTVFSLFDGNWGIVLQSFCMVGSVLQGVSKLTAGILNTKSLAAKYIFLLNIYTEYEQKSEKYFQILDKTASFVTYVVKAIAVVYVILFSWLILSPVVFLAITGRRYLFMQFNLPLLDVNTDVGYFATMLVQMACLIFVGFGNYAGDINVFIYNSQIKLFVDILVFKISSLNEIARNCVETEVTKSKLNDIIDWHQQYSKFAWECNDVLYWIAFTEISSSALSMVLTMFIILTGDWPGAYAFMALQMVALFTYCGMGTMVEITSDQFLDEIYFINWYELSVSQRKCVIMMLMKSQDPNLLRVGGVMPLSVSTGLQVIKSVYSIMMMFVQLME